jgi:hypothetical protein
VIACCLTKTPIRCKNHGNEKKRKRKERSKTAKEFNQKQTRRRRRKDQGRAKTESRKSQMLAAAGLDKRMERAAAGCSHSQRIFFPNLKIAAQQQQQQQRLCKNITQTRRFLSVERK